MKNRTLKWLYAVPGAERAYVAVLAVLDGVDGAIGVVFALLMRNIVDAAVARDVSEDNNGEHKAQCVDEYV